MTKTIEELKKEHSTQLKTMQRVLNKKDEHLNDVVEENKRLESLITALSKNDGINDSDDLDEFIEIGENEMLADIARYYNALLTILPILFNGDFEDEPNEENLNSIAMIIVNSLLDINIYKETERLADVGSNILKTLFNNYSCMLENKNVSADHHLGVDLFARETGAKDTIEFKIVNHI